MSTFNGSFVFIVFQALYMYGFINRTAGSYKYIIDIYFLNLFRATI